MPLRDRRRLVARIARLASDPPSPACEKLTGAERNRIRQQGWRVLYTIEDEVVRVVVMKVGHRREVDRQSRWRPLTQTCYTDIVVFLSSPSFRQSR